MATRVPPPLLPCLWRFTLFPGRRVVVVTALYPTPSLRVQGVCVPGAALQPAAVPPGLAARLVARHPPAGGGVRGAGAAVPAHSGAPAGDGGIQERGAGGRCSAGRAGDGGRPAGGRSTAGEGVRGWVMYVLATDRVRLRGVAAVYAAVVLWYPLIQAVIVCQRPRCSLRHLTPLQSARL